MKSLFIYYSNTGNGDIVAKQLEAQGIDVRKAIRKKKMPKSFFWNVMTGGFLAGIHAKDKLVDFDPSLDGYDRILIGSPIWNGRFSSPINTVLSKLNLEGKELAFVFYSGSGEAKVALKRVAKKYPKAKAVVLKEPKKYPEELKRLTEI